MASTLFHSTVGSVDPILLLSRFSVFWMRYTGIHLKPISLSGFYPVERIPFGGHEP